jgi:hypothetical protein
MLIARQAAARKRKFGLVIGLLFGHLRHGQIDSGAAASYQSVVVVSMMPLSLEFVSRGAACSIDCVTLCQAKVAPQDGQLKQ